MATLLQSTTIGGHSAIHAGNIGSQSVNYANSAGSTAWTNVSGRPTALSQFTNDLGNYGNWITSAALANYLTTSQVTSSMISGLNNMLGVTSLPYSCDIVVEGDQDTYYPVHLIWGDQDVWRRIVIKRGYGEEAPWDPIGTGSHHGGLLLDWEGNFGGWGGADYSDRLRVFQESYTTICADMYRTTHSMGYTFFLRGGGAVYHIFSDQTIRGYQNSSAPDIAYDTDFLFYDSAVPEYRVYAPAPVTTINSSRIDGLRTKKQSQFDGRYLRQGVDISGISNITTSNNISSLNFLASNAYYLNGQSYYLNSSNGGIYTNARFESGTSIVAPGGNSSEWNTAYGWGNHASQGYATQTYVNTAVSNLVDAAPGTLDTLNELAAALGDDPNFATTVTNSIATKLPLTGGTLSGAVIVNLGNVSSDTVAFKVGGPSNYDSLTIGMEDTPDYDAFIASYGNDIRFYSGKNVGSENHSFHWFTSKAGTSQHSSVAMVLDHNQALSVTGVINASGGNSTNWNTAYNWGNHASAGYSNASNLSSGTVPYARTNKVLPTSGNYVWDASTRAGDYEIGVQTSFVNPASGFPEYGAVLHVGARVANDAGGDFQIYCGHGSANGGNHLRFRNADNNANPSDSWTAFKIIWDSENLVNNQDNWNTAYGWGNHASAGYLTSLPSHNHDDRYYTETESDNRYLYYRGVATGGDFQTYQNTANTVRFDQIQNTNLFSNAPGGYTYGGLVSFRGDNVGFQLWGSHTGDFYYKTQWSNDQYSGWRAVIHSANIGSQSVNYASSAGSVAWTNVSGRPTALSQFTNDISVTDSTKLPLAGGTMSGRLTLKSISGVEQTVPNDFGAYLHLGDWGVGRTDAGAVLVNTAYRADYATDLFDMNISRFTNDSGYITSSGSISGNAATATYATSATRLYASDSPYRYGDSSPYYMEMRYDGTYWNLSVTPATPSAVRVAYANSSGTASQVSIDYNNDSNANYQLLWGSGNSVYGTGDVYVNPSSNVINARGGFISNSNPWSTANSAFFPNGITTAGSDNWIYGHTYIGNAPGNGNGHEFWADGNMKSTGHHYLDANYGQTIVGRYSSTVYQGVWAMGDSYKLPMDGSTTGSLYGLAWSHPNAGGVAGNLNTHGLLVMENGTFLAAVSGSIRARDDMRAPYFYGSGSIRVGDMWGGAGLYLPSGHIVFGTEGDNWVFSSAAETQAYISGGDGNLWMRWAGDWLSNLLAAKQDASTAINTSNIGSQSVASATRTSGNSGYGHAGTGMWPFFNWGGVNGGTSEPNDSSYTTGISVGSHPNDQAYGFQIANNMWNTGLWTRNYNSGFGSWIRLIDSDIIGSQSVSYATTAGALTSMNISQFTNNSGYLTSVPAQSQLISPNGATVVAADSAMPNAGHSFIHTLGLGPGPNDGHILGMSWAGTTSSYGAQIFLDTDPNDIMAIRSRSSAGVWTSWKTVIHSGTIGSQSVNYASSAGSAPNASNLNASYGVTAGAGNGLKFWGGSDIYKISMGNSDEYHYGPVTDYSIKTVIDSVGATRGFTWGVNGGTPIAALNVGNGNMQIAGTFNSSNFSGSSSGTNTGDQTNISGTATALNSSNYIYQRGSNGSWNADFQATPAGTMNYGGDLGANGTNGPGGSWWIQQNFRHTNSSNYWGTQVAWGWEDNANKLATRNITGGNYGSWVYYLNSNNITSYMDAPNKAGTSYYQTNTWMQFNGNYGLYWPSNYGAHFYPNDGSSYTQFRTDGNKNGYDGIYLSYSRVNGMMYDSAGNGGVYREGEGRWYWYHHIGNNCTAINTSTTSSSYRAYVGGSLYAEGDIVAYSDRRKKTDIVTIDNALDKVLQLRGVYYTRIDDEIRGRQTGVIAQEINEVLPEVVTYANDLDEYGVSYGNIVGVLIEAIKEQQKEIDELKAKLN